MSSSPAWCPSPVLTSSWRSRVSAGSATRPSAPGSGTGSARCDPAGTDQVHAVADRVRADAATHAAKAQRHPRSPAPAEQATAHAATTTPTAAGTLR